jgi:hypothetical protein
MRQEEEHQQKIIPSSLSPAPEACVRYGTFCDIEESPPKQTHFKSPLSTILGVCIWVAVCGILGVGVRVGVNNCAVRIGLSREGFSEDIVANIVGCFVMGFIATCKAMHILKTYDLPHVF